MKKQKYMTVIGLLIVMLSGSINGASSLTAAAILREVDEHRLLNNSFEMTIRVESYLDNQFENSTMMRGLVNNGEMTSITFLEPLNLKGRKILIKGNDIRMVFPNVKKPVRITPAQRIIGGISYGDIAGISYGDGYTPRLNGEETVEGMNSDGSKIVAEKCFILELTAKPKQANYHQIIIWVEQPNFLPVKADFLALSGKKMLTVYYAAPKELFGKIIVTKMFLFDRINIAKHYILEYSEFKTGESNASSDNSVKD